MTFWLISVNSSCLYFAAALIAMGRRSDRSAYPRQGRGFWVQLVLVGPGIWRTEGMERAGQVASLLQRILVRASCVAV